MELLVFTSGLVALSMLGLATGLFLQRKPLRGGSCGDDIRDREGNTVVSCGACVKKEEGICPTDNDLVRIAQLGYPNPERKH